MESCDNAYVTDGGPCESLGNRFYWPIIKEQTSVLWLEIVFSVLLVVVLLTGLITNSITLAVFCQFKGAVLWGNNHLLVLLNLCICDNITVFFVAPLTVVIMFSGRIFQSALYDQDKEDGTKVLCNTVGFIFNYTSRAILFALAIGAADRFFAIFLPFKYKSIVTPVRVKAIVLACHIISLLVSVTTFLAVDGYYLDSNFATCHYNFEKVVEPKCKQMSGGDIDVNKTRDYGERCVSNATGFDSRVSNPEVVGSVYFFLVLLVVILPASIMVFTSISVVWKLYARLRAKNEAAVKGKLLQKVSGSSLKSDKNAKAKVDPQEQAAVTITYLVVLYVLCYSPWWVLILETFLEYTGSLNYRALLGSASPRFTHYFFLYITLMTFVSSALNPLIYFGRNRMLMEKLEDLIKYKATLKKTPLRNQISGPVKMIPTF